MHRGRNIVKRLAGLLLTVLVAVSFSGCRESMVIQEILYDQAANDIDFQNEMKIAKSDANSQVKDENMPKNKNEDASKKPDEEHKASKKGDKKNEGEAKDSKHNPDSKDKSENDSKGSKTADKGKKDKSSDDDSGAGASDNPNDPNANDENGEEIEPPEDVNNVVVAGAGGAATMVQMLGGTGIIKGTSASFLNDGLAAEVFGSELSDAKQLWDGDGSTAMSSASFEKLLSMKPDVCICVSGQGSFSTSQLQALKKAKIACVTLPRLNTADNIQEAVSVLGEMIGDRTDEGGLNAKKLADDYEEYCDSLIDSVNAKTGLFTWNNIDFNNGNPSKKKTANSTASDGQYTLYISQWESGTYKISSSSTLFSDSGMAIAPQGYANSPLSYYLSVAGVCNNGARFALNTKSEYAVVPFNRNVFKHSFSGSHSFYGNQTESFARVWSKDSIDIGLGEDGFKALIAGSKETKNKIQRSNAWKKYENVTVNGVTARGFAADGKLVTSYVRGNYDVYVNPYGVDSWTEGSVESVLETKWAAWKFHGAYSESEVKAEIKDFYQKFYRYDLSDSQVNRILAGN